MIQLTKISLSLLVLLSVPFVYANAEIDFQHDNILDFTSYNGTGTSTVFSNSTGIYINGTGTTLLKLNNYINSSMLFNQENFNSDDYYFGIKNANDQTTYPDQTITFPHVYHHEVSDTTSCYPINGHTRDYFELVSPFEGDGIYIDKCHVDHNTWYYDRTSSANPLWSGPHNVRTLFA